MGPSLAGLRGWVGDSGSAPASLCDRASLAPRNVDGAATPLAHGLESLVARPRRWGLVGLELPWVVENPPGKGFSRSSSRAGLRSAAGAHAAIPFSPPASKNRRCRGRVPVLPELGLSRLLGTAFPSAESLLKDLKPARSGYKAAPVLYCCFFIPATLGQEQGRFLRSPSEPRSPRMQHRESLPSPRGLGPRSEAGDAPSESVKMEKSIGRASDR